MTRSHPTARPKRAKRGTATVGQAQLTAKGAYMHADAAFCALALRGKRPRAGASALRSAPLAHWNLAALLEQARDAKAPVAVELPQSSDKPEPRLRVRVCPVLRAGGAPKEFLVQVEKAVADAAASRHLAAERDAALRSAQQKGEFLANMSHELRTPLNGIIGFMRLIEDNEAISEDERRDYLRSARTAAMGLLETVNNILDLAKIEADRMTLESVEFEPLRLMEEVCKTLAPQAHGKGIDIAGHAAPQVPHSVLGDPTRLRQVLLNLAGNAVKFTETGAVTLLIEAQAGGPGQAVLAFAVRDTGVGIPDAVQKNLFQSYVQRDESIARRFGGTGLGLAICRQLVEQMGGTIGVESREGGGSTFAFRVPVRVAAAEPPGGRAVLEAARVLVVDPNPHSADVLARNLAALGAQATCVTSAWEAQNRLAAQEGRGQPLQLVIVDHALQREAALAFAHSIRTAQLSFRPDLIYVAQIGQVTDPEAIRAGGFAALLTKPVARTALGDTARELLAAQGAHGSSFAAPLRKTVGELSSLAARHQVRVLVAEDNAVNQKLIHALLSKRGYQVTLVPNGKSAVQAVMNDDYDIVLMDVQMPVMDGLSATREIRRRIEGRLPIVAMTADAMDSDRERCLAAGMDDYLSKPILPDQLNSIMEHWLGRAAAEEPSGNNGNGAAEWGTLDQAHLQGVHAYAQAHRPAAFRQLLALFGQQLAAALGMLSAASGHPERLAAGAHAVALLAEGFGAPRLHALALDLEAQGKEPHSLLVDELVGRLEAEAKSIATQLQRAFPQDFPAASAE